MAKSVTHVMEEFARDEDCRVFRQRVQSFVFFIEVQLKGYIYGGGQRDELLVLVEKIEEWKNCNL